MTIEALFDALITLRLIVGIVLLGRGIYLHNDWTGILYFGLGLLLLPLEVNGQ